MASTRSVSKAETLTDKVTTSLKWANVVELTNESVMNNFQSELFTLTPAEASEFISRL